MLALDTNIVVRVVTEDDPVAAIRARRFVVENDVFMGVAVLLETAWVLEKRYALTRREMIDGLRAFGGLKTVTVERHEEVHRAMAWSDRGMDFADALHLSLASKLEGFVTFDKDLTARAEAEGQPVFEP